MQKIWLIIKREYLTRVRKKSFILATLLVPLGFVALFALQIIIMLMGGTEKLRIAVIDDNQQYYAQSLADTDNLYFKTQTTSLDLARLNYLKEGYNGVLYIPQFSPNTPKPILYYSDKPLGLAAKSFIENELIKAIRYQRLKALEIDKAAYKSLRNIDLKITEYGQEGNSNVVSSGLATGVGMFMGFLMYIGIFIYGTMVMKGIAEEKNNRIVEVMLSSVKPFQLMVGKVVGVGAVGLTQFLIWVILIGLINLGAGFLIALIGTPESIGSPGGLVGGQQIDPSDVQFMVTQAKEAFAQLPLVQLTLVFILYFLGGYLLYASLFAGLGAAVNDDSNSQALTLPISMPIIIAFFILSAIVETPNSNMAIWSSIIPLFSPIIMPARMAFGMPSLWQLLLSLVLLFATVILAIWVAARIYRVGILLYGKKVGFKEIGKWLFSKS